MLCRLISRKDLPVWINCRGEVINDDEGKPHYIIGCMNETETRQRADNISGLLGEKIDDFGTGYSNLRYISEMNPDYVKIDKDFTAMAMRSEKDHELFRKIIEMVHSVNIKICIEGIEKEEWACAMKEIHVDYMQGYLYGRPCEKGVFLNNYVI